MCVNVQERVRYSRAKESMAPMKCDLSLEEERLRISLAKLVNAPFILHHFDKCDFNLFLRFEMMSTLVINQYVPPTGGTVRQDTLC